MLAFSIFLVGKSAAVASANPYEDPEVCVPMTQIDSLVFSRLQQLGIHPADVCSDAVFIRRTYFDVIGTLPTPEEVREFLADSNKSKRNALIERLLERPEFADYWAMKWCDILRVKSEFPINLWPNAVQSYHHWVRASLQQNISYDKFVRALLTSSGSNFRSPPANFYRAVQSRDPATLAQAVALTFMGARASQWPKEQLAGMAAFFSQVGYKTTSEWKEEIVYFDAGKPKAPTGGMLPDGTDVKFNSDQDPREVFANWLISARNPWFARNAVNRIWAWLMGRGIIQDPDDIRPDNPSVNPALLSYLEGALVSNHYDLKQIYRLILKSRTYQLSCVPKSKDLRAEANFAFYPMRPLDAEVVIDAMNQITGTAEKYSSAIPEPYTFIPESERTIALADASISSPFLELFGRSPRDTGLAGERNDRPTGAQRLHMLNSSHIQRKLETSVKLRALMVPGARPRDVVDSLYLTILSRYPTLEELKIIGAAKVETPGSQRLGLDLAWALVNTAEFQYRH